MVCHGGGSAGAGDNDGGNAGVVVVHYHLYSS